MFDISETLIYILPKSFSVVKIMSITIEDISKQLQISVSTVSKALNGYKDVSPKTRDLVVTTAKELGYQPNMAARNLRRGRTDKIGLLINNSIQYVSEYLGEVISGLALTAEEQGSNILLYTAVTEKSDILAICRNREVDGLIVIWSDVTDGTIDLIHSEGIPFVVYGRRVESDEISYVAPDNYNGALVVTQHLIELGHEKIAFTTRPELGTTNEDRFAGYTDALIDAGIPIRPEYIIETKIESGSGYKAMQELLRLPDRPTALFAIHDLLAVGAMRCAQEQGLNIPVDIAIAGFDGLLPSMTTKSEITTVKQPLQDMAQKSMEMLLSRIDQGSTEAKQITYPTELIIRAST